MQLHTLVDSTGNTNMIEKSVLGGTGTEDPLSSGRQVIQPVSAKQR